MSTTKKNATSSKNDTSHISDSQRVFKNITALISDAISKKMNVLLRGEKGVGKTHLIIDASNNNGLTFKYFSTSTLDPYADLVGIPVPDVNREKIRYLRNEDLNNCQLMFFDELNRAHKKVTNAVFEIIQFKSIHGERLNKLEVVAAAVNPWDNENYHTEAMDEALLDRFPIHIDIPYMLNYTYFVNRYSKYMADEIFHWWYNVLNDQLRSQCSPRRVDYIVNAIINGISYKNLNPLDSSLPIKELSDKLLSEEQFIIYEDILANKEKYQEIMSNCDLSNEKTTEIIRTLMSLDLDKFINVLEVGILLPADYLSRKILRDNDYKDVRQAIYSVHGLDGLMNYTEKINSIVFPDGVEQET